MSPLVAFRTATALKADHEMEALIPDFLRAVRESGRARAEREKLVSFGLGGEALARYKRGELTIAELLRLQPWVIIRAHI